MTRMMIAIFFLSFLSLPSMSAGVRIGIRLCSKKFDLRHTPLMNCPQQAVSELQKAFAQDATVGYRLALLKRQLKYDANLVLQDAKKAAQEDRTGMAQYFYATLLEEQKLDSRTWFEKASRNGIGWEEFIRDEQMQLHGY